MRGQCPGSGYEATRFDHHVMPGSRARCPECNRGVIVNVTGRLRRHGRPTLKQEQEEI